MSSAAKMNADAGEGRIGLSVWMDRAIIELARWRPGAGRRLRAAFPSGSVFLIRVNPDSE